MSKDMDDVLSEFLTESAESLDVIDVKLVRFESDPSDQKTLNNIFRLVHTIKGTCGLGPRLRGGCGGREAPFRIGGQAFGACVTDIHDVFRPSGMTPVPQSAAEIAGVLNLRGRIVTAIDARSRLGLPARKTGENAQLAISVEREGESFGLIIDEIGEVARLEEADLEANPVNLDATWASVSRGVYRLDDSLLVIMDIDRMLARPDGTDVAAAA